VAKKARSVPLARTIVSGKNKGVVNGGGALKDAKIKNAFRGVNGKAGCCTWNAAPVRAKRPDPGDTELGGSVVWLPEQKQKRAQCREEGGGDKKKVQSRDKNNKNLEKEERGTTPTTGADIRHKMQRELGGGGTLDTRPKPQKTRVGQGPETRNAQNTRKAAPAPAEDAEKCETGPKKGKRRGQSSKKTGRISGNLRSAELAKPKDGSEGGPRGLKKEKALGQGP